MEGLISKNKLERIITQSIQEYNVFAPTSQDGVKLFGAIKSTDEINWHDGNCLRSPKELFFPMCETIFSFRRGKKGIKIETNGNHNKKRVILGLRPCDARGLKVIDNVFNWEYEDELYLSFRRNSIIITLSCLTPDPYCFCTAINSSPFDETGSDILLTNLHDDLFYVKIITDKGRNFLEKYKDNYQEITQDQLNKKGGIEKELISRMPVPFSISDIKFWLDLNFENPIWEELALGCIGCGTCAYLCPTCHCFDLVDESRGYVGKRQRNWDSCAFDRFTQMTAHQPRPFQWQRFRQRIMHKFKYFIDRFSQLACVGCGRCRALCPAGKDLFKIIQTLENQIKLARKDSKSSKKGY